MMCVIFVPPVDLQR